MEIFLTHDLHQQPTGWPDEHYFYDYVNFIILNAKRLFFHALMVNQKQQERSSLIYNNKNLITIKHPPTSPCHTFEVTFRKEFNY